jgi:excinuclease UvrABC nuclease subunit
MKPDMIIPDIVDLNRSSTAISGVCAGVYFLFDQNELVYIGQGWNCFLRAAEHTRKESDKKFTHWNFIPLEDEMERKKMERSLRDIFKPKYNKI